MTTTPPPAYTKEIVYDRETRDYRMALDGQFVGFARTYHEAEITLDQLAYELLTSGLTRTATELDGGDPEAVTPVEPSKPSDPETLHNYLHARSIAELRSLARAAGVYEPSMRRRVVLIEAIKKAQGARPPEPSKPSIAGAMTGECALCYTIQRCYYEEEAGEWVCTDRDACAARRRNGDPEPPVDDGDEDNWGGFRCGCCGGAHHIQRCPRIWRLLMLPLPRSCPSCGDPILCPACTETGEPLPATQPAHATSAIAA